MIGLCFSIYACLVLPTVIGDMYLGMTAVNPNLTLQKLYTCAIKKQNGQAIKMGQRNHWTSKHFPRRLDQTTADVVVGDKIRRSSLGGQNESFKSQNLQSS